MSGAPMGEPYKVKFDYTAQDKEELTLKIGDIVYVVKKGDDGWWEGTLNGRYGIIPANYVDKA